MGSIREAISFSLRGLAGVPLTSRDVSFEVVSSARLWHETAKNREGSKNVLNTLARDSEVDHRELYLTP